MINADQTQIGSRSRKQAAIDRAMAKAHEQARAGNLPLLLRQFDTDHDTRQVWSVGSRVTAGACYTIDLTADADGIRTLCDCQAGATEKICWHRAAVRLAALGELQYHTTKQPTVPITLADLHGHAGAAPDPWDAEAFAAVS